MRYKPVKYDHRRNMDDPPPLTNINKDYIPSHEREGFDEKKVIKLSNPFFNPLDKPGS